MKVAIVLACIVASALAAPGGAPSWRILGGDDAKEGQFPYQVSLRYYGSHSCGGSIIDEATILCAAHCVDGRSPSAMTVRVGNNKLSAQIIEYEVESFVRHEDYDPYDIINDISIIKLKSHIVFHDKVKSVPLRKSNIGTEEVILSGWGTTTYPGNTPDDLQFIHLQTLSVEKCQDLQSYPVVDSEVCTLTKSGEGACHGDSGGPLVDLNGEQIGIVSWGIPCGQGYPDVFTRVHSFLDWIDANRS